MTLSRQCTTKTKSGTKGGTLLFSHNWYTFTFPLTNELDAKIMKTKKDGWRDNIQKTKAVRYAIAETLKRRSIEHPTPEHILNIVRKQQDY